MNSVNPWLVIPLVLSQLAGIAGLVLSVHNYRRAKEEPERTEQREKRNELRELLFAVRQDLLEAVRKIDYAEDLPDDEPKSLTTLMGKFPEFREILDQPTSSDLYQLENVLISTRGMLRPVPFEDMRKKMAAEAKTKEVINLALPMVNNMISVVGRLNKALS